MMLQAPDRALGIAKVTTLNRSGLSNENIGGTTVSGPQACLQVDAVR